MPCQPFSTAGKRKGTKDERHLWPYVRDAIRALRPRLVVLENVRGHLTLGFDAVLTDLAALGMSARWGVVRASDAGAPHGRARLFIVAWLADAEDVGLERGGRARDWWARSSDGGGDAADTESDARRLFNRDGESSVDWGKYEPAIRRWEHVLGRPAPAPAVPRATGRDRLSPAFVEWMMGLPAGHVTGHGLSHGAELTLLGNGVVPQQAALALRMLLPHALTPAA